MPAGKHAVELYNSGRDSLYIERLTLPRYAVETETPNVRCIGLVGKDTALLWVQNGEHILASIMDKQPVFPAEGVKVMVQGIPQRECAVEWWDTAAGTVTRTTRERPSSAGLTLELPSLATDIALKVRW